MDAVYVARAYFNAGEVIIMLRVPCPISPHVGWRSVQVVTTHADRRRRATSAAGDGTAVEREIYPQTSDSKSHPPWIIAQV